MSKSSIHIASTSEESSDLFPWNLRNLRSIHELVDWAKAALKYQKMEAYKHTIRVLVKGILHKADGCWTDSVPDKNDKIVDCEAQDEVLDLIEKSIREMCSDAPEEVERYVARYWDENAVQALCE